MAVARDAARAQLLELLDRAFSRRSWHGTNLRGSVRRVTAEEAGWRPVTRARHSIAEIVVHCAYWKYAVRRRLTGEKRGSFPLKGSDWFALPDALGATDWNAYVALLTEMHAGLRAAIEALPARQLAATPTGSTVSTSMLIQGVALHDVYHAGQIQQVKALMRVTGAAK